MELIREKKSVVMFPCLEDSRNPLILNPSTGLLTILNPENSNTSKNFREIGYTTYHLYFLSDEKTKKGDWYFYYNSPDMQGIAQAESDEPIVDFIVCKKIFATTNSNLWIKKEIENVQGHFENMPLPSPTNSFVANFVENYNKENLIKEVDVEYYYSADTKTSSLNTGLHNTIVTHPIKDFFNKEEVKHLLKSYRKYVLNNSTSIFDLEKWIEKNL